MSAAARRQALLDKFRAAAADRLARIMSTLGGIGDPAAAGGPAAEAGPLREVARELHTLKGESRLLGLAPISEALHTIESQLAGAGGDGDWPQRCAAALRDLETVSVALRDSGPALIDAASDAPGPSVSLPPEQRPTATTPPGHQPQRWVQVSTTAVDGLCDQVEVLAADLRSLLLRLRALGDERGAAAGRALCEEADRCQRQIEALSAAAWSLRLVPVEPLFTELCRHARELARAQGKRVRLRYEGGDAQIERGILDQLWDPLLHLMRNAIDHGIEPPAERGGKPPEGRITLSAEALGPSLVLQVADDGRGVCPEAVRATAVARGLLPQHQAGALREEEVLALLFTHGFSTREQVSDLSGRGVGLDVVRVIIEGLGGAVRMQSAPGQGTRFALTVPATFSKERMVILECQGLLYAIPSRHVLEVARAADRPVQAVPGGRAITHRGEGVPLRSLSAILGHGTASPDGEPWVLLLESGGRRHALSVPALCGERELLRQPTDALLAPLDHVGASALLEDGRLVLVVTAAGLLRRAAEADEAPGRSPAPTPGRSSGAARAAQEGASRRRVLVVDDSAIVRDLVRQILVDAGLEVQLAPEAASALRVLQGAQAPDAVLLDVDMPGMDGFTALERIRARLPDLPVVMFTTRHAQADRDRAAALGATAYLIKSGFEEATLVQTLRRVMG